MLNLKSQLAIGVGSAALITGLSAPANAACVVDAATVTCTADSNAAEANAALGSVAGGDVSLNIATDATVVQPSALVQPTQQGQVDINNAGDVGTETAPVGVFYLGTLTDAANAFNFDNSGSVTGELNVTNVGGAVDIVNSGLLAGGVFVSAEGPATLTSTGQIDGAGSQPIVLASRTSADAILNGDVGRAATATSNSDLGDSFIQSQFREDAAPTTETETVDGVTTTTSTSSFTRVGGTASAIVGENANTGSIEMYGLDGAVIDVNGTVGSETEFDSLLASSNAQQGSTVTVNQSDGTNSSFSRTTSSTRIGSTASIAISETGSVTGNVQAIAIGNADIAIDGVVGTPANTSFVSASSNGNASSSDVESNFNSDTGANSFAQTASNISSGSNASVVIGETGIANASVSASGNGDASVANAGIINGSVSANATGNNSTSGSASSSDGAGNSESSSFSTNETTGGNASIANATGGLIGLDDASPVSVSAFGNVSSSVDNAGRINGNVNSTARGSTSQQANSNSSATSTDVASGTTTSVNESMRTNATSSLGGDARFTNAESGLVTSQVNVDGAGSANVINEGAVIGQTFASSRTTDSAFVESTVTTSVSVPGVDGGRTTTVEVQRDQSNISSGGDVTGVYAGTNGAVQFAPLGGASDGSVSQSADGDSTAVVSGTILGGFTGNATGNEFVSSFSNAFVSTFDADGDQRSFDRESLTESSNRRRASDSSLVVDGGRIAGDALVTGSGSASAQIVNGGSIEGSLSATAQAFGGNNRTESYDLAQIFDEDGNFVSGDQITTTSSDTLASSGAVSVNIVEGVVAGSVVMNGAGGSNNFSLGADGFVGGAVLQTSRYSAAASDQTRTASATPTSSNDLAQTQTASGGDVTATIAGTIGIGDADPQGYGDIASAGGNSLSLSTDAGNATATVNGQVRNGISVIASGSDTLFALQEERVNGARTAYSQQSGSTVTGGAASLDVNADNLDVPANFGNISVRGRSGSSVTIGASSSVLAATNGAFMQVGTYFSDNQSTFTQDDAEGVLTGTTSTSDQTVVGGPASLTNAGRIGFDGGTAFDGNNGSISVFSASEASVLNDGQVFGSIGTFSLYEDISSTTVTTDLGDVTQVSTTTTTYAANGGSARLTNNGLVTGNATIAAQDGSLINNGVLRGDVTLGGSVENFTTRTIGTLTQFDEEDVLDLADAIEQGYAVEQNGLLGGTISVAGAFSTIDPSVRTSNIVADIALNSGSVTGGGISAEYDEVTGERFTTTTVTLDGAGHLGLGDAALADLEDAFVGIDPAIRPTGDLSAYRGGARVLGVDTLTKTGAGVFLVTGAPFAPTSNTNSVADYTLDVGNFAITAGEIQLATIGDESVFGIRGNIDNAAGLVLGSRVQLPAPLFGTNASVTAIDGVQVYQNGNFTQTANGTLSIGITPTLVRVTDPAFSSVSSSTNPLAVQSIGLGSGLFTTPENAFGQAFTDLGTGLLTVDGNMTLGGTVQLVSPTGGLFTAGQMIDIASVSGTVTSGASVAINSPSNFVTFDLGTRTENGRTILFASAERAGFETAGTNQNATAAGAALSAAFPDVIASIRAGSAGGIGTDGNQFVLSQDLANLFVGFDMLLTMDQVATSLTELASGEFYGSLTTLQTTAPFINAISSPRVPTGSKGFNVWLAPSGDFIDFEGDGNVGSRDIDANNYGGSAGFGVGTGNGEIGVGVGYGRISANSQSDLLMAEADTWMVGAYLRQSFGNFAIGANLVYGLSDWNATRVMPTLSRTAVSEFDSTELRGDLRAEYRLDFGGGWVAPYGQISFRKFDFESFTEEDAGAVNLVVQDADATVLTPTLGLRAGTRFDAGLATLRPEVTLAYSFDDDNKSFRDVAYLGAPSNDFRLQGVDPEGYFTVGAGLFADIGAASGAFLRASYATGSNIDVASVNAGVTIGF